MSLSTPSTSIMDNPDKLNAFPFTCLCSSEFLVIPRSSLWRTLLWCFTLPLFLSICLYTEIVIYDSWCSQSSTVTAQALDMGCRCDESKVLCWDNRAYCPQCELQRQTKCPVASGRAPQRHPLPSLPLGCCWEERAKALICNEGTKAIL